MSETLDQHFRQLAGALDLRALQAQFVAQNEFLSVSDFLPTEWLKQLTASLTNLEPRVHRNYIPRHKKGGSISKFDLDEYAPVFGALYQHEGLREILIQITGQLLLPCPGNDPHSYALYYYTEAGDHIGYHYDTSYYRGARYTILIGIVDDSSCRLEYQLYKDDPARSAQVGSLQLTPRSLVIFNGDKLYHRITPLAEGEIRIALTLEYVTSAAIHPFRRFVSNMKDAIAYFGFKQVFKSRAS
ncbi:MAG: 2OG-Fe(II) oxygenase [Gammaproteobacteria bacterium]|nr:2OG-Fe(II) oxygenase [Gammaproteobacteria bacterium]